MKQRAEGPQVSTCLIIPAIGIVVVALHLGAYASQGAVKRPTIQDLPCFQPSCASRTDHVLYAHTFDMNLSPHGFRRWAQHFRACRQSFVSPDPGFSPVPYFLNCRAIELELKAHVTFSCVLRARARSKR
jgi:hypothetical protein